MIRETWTLAIKALVQIEKHKVSESLALSTVIKQLRIQDTGIIRFAHKLVMETVRRLNLIDRFINESLEQKSTKKLPLNLIAFLRLYVYQTRMAKDCGRIDIKEAEKIADLGRSILGWKNLRDIEHVLGRLLTKKLNSIFISLSDAERIGLQTFHPSWFVRYCFKLFGRKEALAFLEANWQSPPTYIRLNTNKMDKEEIRKRLTSQGIKLNHVRGLRQVFTVRTSNQRLTSTQSFQKGLFFIQDKASCFAVEAADPRPGLTVLDVCAAPGAKTTYLAQLMQNEGKIYAIDYSKRRMEIWRGQINLLGTKNAVPIIADAYNSLPLRIEADIVVLDPPCTSTGVFGKHPTAKWRLTPDSIHKMADIQWKMINQCAKKVRLGGTLIYSTCSITVEENEELIERFLKCNPKFQLAEITPKIGLPALRGLEECRRLYPHLHQCSGFFVAKMRKKT